MGEMVERVARLIAGQWDQSCAEEMCSVVEYQQGGCACRHLAVDVIEAMREPTQDMIEQGWETNVVTSHAVPIVWRAMIAAALTHESADQTPSSRGF